MILTEPDDTLTAYSAGYGVVDPNGLDILNRRQNWGLNNTYTFSPSFSMTSTIDFNRVSVDGKSGDCCETNYAEVFGIPGLEKGGEVFPRFNIHGGRGVPMTQLGTAGNADRIAVFTNFDYEANFTKIRGNHTFKFGAKYTSVSRQRGQPPATLRGLEADGQLYRLVAAVRRRPEQQHRHHAGESHAWAHPEHRHARSTRHRKAHQLLLGLLPRRLMGDAAPDAEYRNAGRDRDSHLRGRQAHERLLPVLRPATRWAERNPRRDDRACPVPQQGWQRQVLLAVRQEQFCAALRLKEDSSMVLRGGFGIFYGNSYVRNFTQPGRAGFDNIFRIRGGLSGYLRDGVPAGALDDVPESELHGGFGAIGTRFETSTIQFWAEA